MGKNYSAKLAPPPLTLIQCCAKAVLTHRTIRDPKDYIPIVKRIYRVRGQGGKTALEIYLNEEILMNIHRFLDVLDYMVDNGYTNEDYR